MSVDEEFDHFNDSEIYEGSCRSKVNHAIGLVGYGVSGDAKKYWIIVEIRLHEINKGTGSPGGQCVIHYGFSFYPTLKVMV